VNSSHSIPSEVYADLALYAHKQGISKARALAYCLRLGLGLATGAAISLQPGDPLSLSVAMVVRSRGLPPQAAPEGFDPDLDSIGYATEGESS
jgi:hypothetical protein